MLSHPIGNNGNKFDESVAACNTPSCNAVYDGCHYYYLPWGHEKPCVCVECSWEDIAFRLEPVNILSKLVERLVSEKIGYRATVDYGQKFIWQTVRKKPSKKSSTRGHCMNIYQILNEVK